MRPARGLAAVLPLTLLCMSGCPKKGTSPELTVLDGLLVYAKPADEVFYTRMNVAQPFELPAVPVKEVLHGPAYEGERVMYDLVSENATTGKELEATRVFYGPEGYGYIGTVRLDGTVETWDPPQIVLPPNPKVGDSWQAEHKKGASLSVRSCEIMAPEACEDGLVVVCESRRDGGVIVLRDHFCAGVGWSGFEALVQAPGSPTLRMWSEGVVRDGHFTPVVPPPEQVEASPEPEAEAEQDSEAVPEPDPGE